ncbi:MAG TPA: carboxymuconolactone decarboxylase family protein [Thermomicrobiaceae bacterium]|nr:carboxymuconolactone decarboxylase family protein [Thermomicrobiaceae bacterium]
MPTLPYLEEEDAGDEVRRLYQEIKAGFGAGQVPNVYKVLGNNPDILAAALDNRRRVMEQGELDATLKEFLAWASVTLANNEFGIKVHTARLKKLGYSNAQILEALAILQYFTGISAVINGLAMGDDVNQSVLKYLEGE